MQRVTLKRMPATTFGAAVAAFCVPATLATFHSWTETLTNLAGITFLWWLLYLAECGYRDTMGEWPEDRE